MAQLRGKGQSVCYLCQARPGTTRDHVPPRNLITDRTVAQLITAPCCERCRNANQKDDEYFRTVMVITADPKATFHVALPLAPPEPDGPRRPTDERS